MPTITLPNNWIPRPDQRPLWDYLEGGGRRAVAVAHRRFGKDDVALHFTATQAPQRIGNYWHMLPQYGQARKTIWDAINPKTGKRRIDEAFPREIRTSTRETDMYIGLRGGSSWQLVGSDNYNSLVGSNPIGIVFSEWALSNPQAWVYLSPILEENKGWALFISTSRGNNHLKSAYDYARVTPGWFSQLITAANTVVFTTDQLERIKGELIALHGQEYGEAMFLQEYFCSWEGAVLGAYYSKQMSQARAEGRIGVVPWDPAHEVDTWWDLGVDDSMSIWFVQPIGFQVKLIDYYEASGYGLEHYARIIREKPYLYANHIMPHDAEAREMSGPGEVAQSIKDNAEALGIKPIQTVERARNMTIIVQNHIPAVRRLLSRCWFDEKNCLQGIAALEAYAAEYDEEKKILSNKPMHNWASHGCFTSETYLLTKSGKYQIMDLPNKGEVLTLCGWKAYQNPRVTRRNARLVEVVLSDGSTVRCTPDHLFLTENGWKSAESLTRGILIQSSLIRLRNILMVAFIELGLTKDILRGEARNYIEMLGRWLLGKYQKAVIFITKIEMYPTTICQISNVCQYMTTCQMNGITQNQTLNTTFQNLQDQEPLIGTNQKRGACGTEDTPRGLSRGLNGKERFRGVQSVIKNLWPWFVKAATPKFIVRHIVNPLAVISVTELSHCEDVWCITVPDIGHFSLANGAIVHNCDAFRTGAMGYEPKTRRGDGMEEIERRRSRVSWRAR